MTKPISKKKQVEQLKTVHTPHDKALSQTVIQAQNNPSQYLQNLLPTPIQVVSLRWQ